MSSDILKSKAKQFPVEDMHDKKQRIVRGWISVEVKDSQGELIPVSQLRKSLNTWIMRGGMISDTHSNRIIGKGLRWFEAEHPGTGKPGIIIEYQIFNDYSIDNEVWDEILSGERKGLSFGGRALNEPKVKEDKDGDGMVSELTGIEAYEMSSVKEPANKFAENTQVNFLAKSGGLNKLEKDLQKGYTVININNSFSGFKNFDACVASQKERGHTVDSAERICGWLKNRTEDNQEEKEKSYDGEEEKQRDPAAVCGGLWFNGTDKQRSAFGKGTEGRGREEKAPEAWMDDCVDTIGKSIKGQDYEEEEKEYDEDDDLEKKSDLLIKILQTKRDKKKATFTVVNLPKGMGRVLDVQFPDGQRQVLRLSKSKGKEEDELESAIRNAVRSFNSTLKTDIQKGIDYYNDRFKEHGDSAQSVLWLNKDVQKIRFMVLEKVFEGNDIEVLDAGCGLGHLNDHLKGRGYKVKYKGIDNNENFINSGKEKGLNVLLKNIKDLTKSNDSVDYVIASGVYNLRKSGDWKIGMQNLFNICNKGLAINFITKAPDQAYREFTEKEIKKFADSLGAKTEIIKGYLTNDITCILRKKSLKSKSLNRSEIIKKIKSLKLRL